MLPTTGHFKNISCPFYDACICERPYCHFKHSKRETLNDANLISELVSKAVHKVLSSNSSNSPQESSEKPLEVTNVCSRGGNNVTYNPTPISELNKYKVSSVKKEIPEKKIRHIPIQYTPEQPRSFRSIATTNYSSTLEYGPQNSKSTLPNYSTAPTSVSYIPSLIKTSDNAPIEKDSASTNSQTIAATDTHQYVPFHINSEESSQTLTAEYNPTKNLSNASISSNNEYVPKYNDEFIDEFLNDPNIYEPTEIISVTLKNDPKAEKTCLVNSGHKKSTFTDDNNSDSKSKRNKLQISEEKEKTLNNKKQQKSSSDSSKKLSDTSYPRSSSSSHSKHSSKSKHKDKRKDRGKQYKQNGCEKELKHSDKDHKNRTEGRNKSRDRNKPRKSVESIVSKREKTVNNDKISEHVKNLECKVKSKRPSENDHCRNSPVSDDMFDSNIGFASDESDDELEQCKRIFEEYQPPRDNLQIKKHVKQEEMETETTSLVAPKKRVARDKSVNVVRNPISKPKSVKSAALVMTNRYKQMLSTVEERNVTRSNSDLKEDVSQDCAYPNPAKMKRIAHVPNVNSLLSAKKKVEEIVKNKPSSKTPMQTISKGSKRVAHIPEVSVADIPPVLHSDKSKLPVNVRSKFLFLMVQECVKLYVSKKAAYDRALNEELNCYFKCSAIATYRNSVMLSINRLRKEAESGITLSSVSNTSISDFCGKKLYDNIKKWILTEEELLENGYPRPGASKKGHAFFKVAKLIEKIPDDCQQCVRCRKIYKINDGGFQVYPEDCIYHPGSRFVYRGETKYICCKESVTNTGCCVCSNHVFEIRDPNDLTGFVSTFYPEMKDDPKSYAVYALDCEMVYTTRGFELARVTVIDSNCDVVFETLIKPTGHILDCNTRYSGLTTEMLEKAPSKITEVQATLLLLFNSETILIGHSLESDLKVLRLIHSTVIDTSVLFPHKMGPPKKRSLKALAVDILKKIIQNDEAGHDSAEDAIACMELVIWKLKEEIKLRF